MIDVRVHLYSAQQNYLDPIGAVRARRRNRNLQPTLKMPELDQPHNLTVTEVAAQGARKNGFLEASKEIIAGSLSGIAGVSVGYPLDTIKTRMQTNFSLSVTLS